MDYNKFYDDIYQCSLDYLEHFSKNNLDIDILLVTNYVYSILYNIYDSTFKKKYLYEEFIEQIISIQFPELNKHFIINPTCDIKEALQDRVKILANKPQEEQRSLAWYKKRETTIGASELACIFNKSPFCSYNKYLLKKVGYKDPNVKNSVNEYCLHGIKYEDIIIKLIESRNKLSISEYGSITDEDIKFIAASPDGIDNNGNMYEIKCPPKRKILGIPPIYYWLQMQQQLNVCKLNKCCFIECRITEYSDWNEFSNDNFKGNFTKNSLNLEKGVLIEYLNINETDPWNKVGYIYPNKIDMTLNDIYIWKETIKTQLNNDINKLYSRIIPWKLEKYSCVSVYKNIIWWEQNFPKISDFWKKVLDYKKNGFAELLTKKKRKLKIKKQIEYTFLIDE